MKWNRWLYAGILWERESKGFYVNVLTFTFDIGYGKFGEAKSSFEIYLKHIPKNAIYAGKYEGHGI